MEIEFIQLVLANAPNYIGFVILAYQQYRIIETLLRMLDDKDA